MVYTLLSKLLLFLFRKIFQHSPMVWKSFVLCFQLPNLVTHFVVCHAILQNCTKDSKIPPDKRHFCASKLFGSSNVAIPKKLPVLLIELSLLLLFTLFYPAPKSSGTGSPCTI